MKPKVFLDSGIFIAFMNQRDRWHDQAVALFCIEKPRWATSILVRSETYSWFLHRFGEEAARTFHRLVDNLTGLTIFGAEVNHQAEINKILNQYRGAKLTYVDASSLALINKHEIHEVWSTDHHLSLSGASILPRG